MSKAYMFAVCALTLGSLWLLPNDLIVDYSGSIDLGATTLQLGSGCCLGPQMSPQSGILYAGPLGNIDLYSLAQGPFSMARGRVEELVRTALPAIRSDSVTPLPTPGPIFMCRRGMYPAV
jgi:hypothetical protein